MIDNLSLIEKYLEIIDGVSCFELNFPIYIGHLTQYNIVELSKNNIKFLENARSNGIKTEQEQVDFIIDRGWWNISNEIEIKNNEALIERLLRTKKNLKYPSEKKRLEEQILEYKKKIDEIKNKRSSLISITAENIASHKIKNWFIINFFFKDKFCSEKLFDNESFDFLLDSELELYDDIYQRFLSKISNYDIQLIAASIFFQNIFFVGGKSCYDFFGKPVVKLTRNQNDLFLYGRMFRSFMDNSIKKIPNEILEDPEKFILYVESANQERDIEQPVNNRKITNSKGRQKVGRSSSFLFGDISDAKQMGIKTGEKELFAKAEAKGGQTSLVDEIL